MSASPSVRSKAERYLRDRCVVITCDDADGISAAVSGDHGVYKLHLTPSGWRCPCEARIRNCSHVVAVEAVTGWRQG